MVPAECKMREGPLQGRAEPRMDTEWLYRKVAQRGVAGVASTLPLQGDNTLAVCINKTSLRQFTFLGGGLMTRKGEN